MELLIKNILTFKLRILIFQEIQILVNSNSHPIMMDLARCLFAVDALRVRCRCVQP